MAYEKLPDGMLDASFDITIRVKQHVKNINDTHINEERVKQVARAAVLEELQRQAQAAIDAGELDLPPESEV